MAMDELIQHCLRELSFDGDLGELLQFSVRLNSRVAVKSDVSGATYDTLVEGFEPTPGRVLFGAYSQFLHCSSPPFPPCFQIITLLPYRMRCLALARLHHRVLHSPGLG